LVWTGPKHQAELFQELAEFGAQGVLEVSVKVLLVDRGTELTEAEVVIAELSPGLVACDVPEEAEKPEAKDPGMGEAEKLGVGLAELEPLEKHVHRAEFGIREVMVMLEVKQQEAE